VERELDSVAEYAAHLGRSTRTVQRMLEDGMPRLQRKKRGAIMINRKRADGWLEKQAARN
jgi:hypothetical protein